MLTLWFNSVTYKQNCSLLWTRGQAIIPAADQLSGMPPVSSLLPERSSNNGPSTKRERRPCVLKAPREASGRAPVRVTRSDEQRQSAHTPSSCIQIHSRPLPKAKAACPTLREYRDTSLQGFLGAVDLLTSDVIVGQIQMMKISKRWCTENAGWKWTSQLVVRQIELGHVAQGLQTWLPCTRQRIIVQI